MIVKVRVVSTSDWKVGGDHFEKLYLKLEQKEANDFIKLVYLFYLEANCFTLL